MAKWISRAEAGWFWPAVFIGYFAFHAVYRWIIGGNLGLDEGEAMIEGQRLAWGYGAQPPLYAWLQWAVFRAIGDPLLAMSVLKNLLLATTYLAVYALMRTAHGGRVAGLAAASMMLLPQVSWESQRALTHSVLATTLAALSVLVFWRSVLGGRRGACLAFGAVTALGLLSKASFVFVPVALLVAAASSAEFRPRLRPVGLALTLAVVAALVAAPMAWAVAHPDLALSSAHKLHRGIAAPSRTVAAAEGIGWVLAASAGFLGPLALVAVIIRWRFPGGSGAPPAPLDRFLIRLILAGLGVVAVFVLTSGATFFGDRWLLPVLFMAAPATTAWLLGRVSEAGQEWLAGTLAGLGVLVVLALPIHLRTGTPGKPARGDAPIEALVQAFPSGAAAQPVLADPVWLAGNLLYRHPDWSVADAGVETPPAGATSLLVWPEHAGRGARLARELSARAGQTLRLGEVTRLAAPFPWQPGKEFVLYVAPLVTTP